MVCETHMKLTTGPDRYVSQSAILQHNQEENYLKEVKTDYKSCLQKLFQITGFMLFSD